MLSTVVFSIFVLNYLLNIKDFIGTFERRIRNLVETLLRIFFAKIVIGAEPSQISMMKHLAFNYFSKKDTS